MALVNVISITEAAAFASGCVVLNARRFDAERVGAVLMLMASALIFVLLVVVTLSGGVEAIGIDLDEVHSILD